LAQQGDLTPLLGQMPLSKLIPQTDYGFVGTLILPDLIAAAALSI